MTRAAVANIDAWVRGLILGVYDYFALVARGFGFIARRPFYWKDTLAQMDRIGVGSLPILLLTGGFTGMVLALQSGEELSEFGATMFLGQLVGISMIRELGPVLAALGVAGRSGSAIAAELSTMRISEQIDALQTFGTDPIKKLVTPRFLALVIMLPILTIVTDFVGILGGMMVSMFSAGLSPDVFLRGVWSAFAYSGFALGFLPRDFIIGLSKPIFFGAIIAATGCYYGLAAQGGAEAVGRATTRSVVTASIMIFVSDYFLTAILIVLLEPPI
jgi:phospholipid/cholesterol/gamma-HCH transport system permease protein